jgi:hypothetical protein
MVYDRTAEIERDEIEASGYVSHHIRFRASVQVGDDECFSARGDFRHYPLVSGPDSAICVELVYPTSSKRAVVGDIIAAWRRESSDLTYQEWVKATHRQAGFVLMYGTGFMSN